MLIEANGPFLSRVEEVVRFIFTLKLVNSITHKHGISSKPNSYRRDESRTDLYFIQKIY